MEEPFFKKFLKSPLTLVGVTLAFFAVSYRVIDVSLRYRTIYLEEKDLHARITDAQKKNDAVKKDIEYAESAGFLEREGKARLNLKKPGEEVLVILPENQATATPVQPKLGWLERMSAAVKSFFGY